MNAETTSAASTPVAETLRSITGPIFAAVWTGDEKAPSLTVHLSSVASQRALREQIVSSLCGVTNAAVKVKFHSASSLLSSRSLEAFVARLGGDRVAYDPTGSMSRALGLVQASRVVRAALKERTSGLYYAPLLRTFYVTLDRSRVSQGDKVQISELAAIERAVLESLSSAFAGAGAACPSVRVGFGLPSASLVPVDAQSVVGWGQRLLLSVRRYWKPVTVAAMFGFGAVAPAAAQDPAVSEANLKVRGSFGEIIDDYTWNAEGAFTAPLGEKFGLMIEGGGGASNGNGYYGAAAHLFTRDPDSYLLGVFGAYSEGSSFDIDATRVGGEFEFYLNEITISGMAGYQFSQSLGDKTFGSFDLKWYATNNFAVTAGVSADEDRTLGRARLEWQPGFAALPGLAFHADGAFGEDDYQSIMGGLTYYFGSPVDLKDRHRRQDPDSALFGLFQSVRQEQQRLCAQYATC